MNRIILKPKKTLKLVKAFSRRKVASDFLNPDTRRGNKDGKQAPDAWSFSLQAIEAEESRAKEEARSTFRQAQHESKTSLEHIDALLKQNREEQKKLNAEGGMLPESVAAAQRASSVRHKFIALILTFLDAFGVITILRFMFGGRTIFVVPLGILLVAGVVFGIKNLLGHLSPEGRAFAVKLLMFSGIALVVTGLVGFALLRSETFNATLIGTDIANAKQISLGNLLFTLGIVLGVPLVIGVWYETENAKKETADISLRLYVPEKRLLKTKTEWLSLSKRVEELDARLDNITADIIRLRHGRYVRGYINGVRTNQDAGNYINAIMKHSEQVFPARVLMLQTAGNGRV